MPVLFLTERSVDLIPQRLDRIGRHRSLAGLNEGFGGHPRYQRELAKARKLLWRHGDANDIVGQSALLILRQIGGNPADLAFQLRRGSLIEGRHAQNRSLMRFDLAQAAGHQVGLLSMATAQSIGTLTEIEKRVAG
jgi:hypothetical protein